MKTTGIVRRIDELGRVVIPREVRNICNLAEGDPVEIFVEKGNVILKKYQACCIFCGTTDNILNYKGKPICLDCKDDLGADKE